MSTSVAFDDESLTDEDILAEFNPSTSADIGEKMDEDSAEILDQRASETTIKM